MRKRFNVLLTCLAAAISGIILFNIFSGNAQAALPRNCDNNSIIHCGALDAGELSTKYNENKTGDLPAIYSAYDISSADIAGGTAKMGLAHKDGRVTVDGETVATDSYSIGRQNLAGSSPKTIAGKTYYNSASSTVFKSDSIATLVFFDANGQFKAGVITSCGNPLEGNPVPPKKPKPPVEKPKEPIYKCDSLTIRTIKLEDRSYAFDLTYTALNGASLKSVDYAFGDGTGRENVSPIETKNVTHSYTKAGTYTTTATLHFTTDGSDVVKDANCKVTVTTSPEMCPLNPTLPVGDARCEPCPIPGKERYPKDDTIHCVAPPVTPPELPKTGPMDFVGGALGLGSLVAAGYYWYTSRRGLTAAYLEL